MSERRSSRRSFTIRAVANRVPDQLPSELVMGPCIEVWAERWPRDVPEHHRSTSPSFAARRNWQRAVEDWAERTGWAHEGRPAGNAQNLARIRTPYSLTYLRGNGRGRLADYLQGKRSARPDESDLAVNVWRLSDV